MEQAQARRPIAQERGLERRRALRGVPSEDRNAGHRSGTRRGRGHRPRPEPPAEAEVFTIELPARPPARERSQRSGALTARPERLAGWAVVLCLLMALVAAATAGGDEQHDPAALPAPSALER